MMPEPYCNKCKHYQGVKELGDGEDSQVNYCPAFPDGIPHEIAYGGNDHTTKHDEQSGELLFMLSGGA